MKHKGYIIFWPPTGFKRREYFNKVLVAVCSVQRRPCFLHPLCPTALWWWAEGGGGGVGVAGGGGGGGWRIDHPFIPGCSCETFVLVSVEPGVDAPLGHDWNKEM